MSLPSADPGSYGIGCIYFPAGWQKKPLNQLLVLYR